MIKITSLKSHIQVLLKTPDNESLLSVQTAIFNYWEAKSIIEKPVTIRQHTGCHELNQLVRLINKVYVELTFSEHRTVARALILLLDLLKKLGAELSPRCKTASVPKVLLDRAKSTIRRNSTPVRNKLLAAGIDEKLISIVMKPLSLLEDDNKINYMVFTYVDLHIKALRNINLQHLNFEEARDELCRLMVELNFNDLGFTNYYAEKVRRTLIDSCNDIYDKIRYLSIQERKIKNLTRSNRYCYDLDYRATKDYLVRWLRDERRRLRMGEQLRFL